MDQFRNKVLLIDSNMESVITAFKADQTFVNLIPQEIRQTNEYSNFINDLKRIIKLRDNSERDFLKDLENKFREKTEPTFHKMIEKRLRKAFPSTRDRLLAIETNEAWQWLGKLYPAVFTSKRQVIFMSMDKFLSRNTTLVEPSYLIQNASFLNNALIFIDEFDATKETVLNNIINNDLRYNIDQIELFKYIYNSLHTDSFPKDLTTSSHQRLQGKYASQSLESIIDNLKQEASRIFDYYSLQFKHRTSENIVDPHRNFLFQDHQFHTILNENVSFISRSTDPNNCINTINISSDKPQNDQSNIKKMLGELVGFTKYFIGAVRILAQNYVDRKNENNKNNFNAEIFTLESAVRSVLDVFNVKEYSDYLTNEVLNHKPSSSHRDDQTKYDLSFYENGFSYYAFEDNLDHDLQSKIMRYTFNKTPEKILLRLCEKAKVIGISATATIPTVIGNYDLEYLKIRLKDQYFSLSDEDKNRLINDYKSKQSGYDHVNINVEFLGCHGSYSDQSWELVFSNQDLAHEIVKIINNQIDEDSTYAKERYLRIALAYKQFLLHDDLKSFLCVLTKHPKSSDPELNKDLLAKIFDFIGKEQLENDPNLDISQIATVYLNGDNYESNKNDILNKLKEGKKIFVISVYQTIGAGQNLQYEVPLLLKDHLIKINEKNLSQYKDFDAIYLDRPTNILVNLSDDLTQENFVKFLFQMEFLQENYEISRQETKQCIRAAFKTLSNKKMNFPIHDLSKRRSVIRMSTRLIIQAIGRICRTNLKSKNIYIYADERIANYLDPYVVQGRIFNPEFMKLVDKIKEKYPKNIITKESDLDNYEKSATFNANRTSICIKNMLNNWNELNIKKWKELRQIVLKFPTILEQEAKQNIIFSYFYAKLPQKDNRMFFQQENDFRDIKVFSVNNLPPKYQILDEQGSKLCDLLKIHGVKDHFDSNGYATEFKPNDYLMTPALWNNIYKGALGEVVGKFIFDKYFGINLEEISDPTIFELFDYKVPNSSMFVDFKNWHEGKTTDESEMIEKIEKKAKHCNCKCAIIVNIITSINDTSIISYKKLEDLEIISIPSLFKINGETAVMNEEAKKFFNNLKIMETK